MKGKLKNSATARAPATIGNAGIGFDILGLAVDAAYDTVTVSKTKKPGQVEIKKITGAENLPTDPHKNTATVGLIRLASDLKLNFGFEVSIKKGIPLGSGMGGSAASAVAAIVASSALLAKPLKRHEQMKYALIGESLTGGAFGDNIASCLYGGMVLVTSIDPVEVISIPFPANIFCVLVHPNFRLDTRISREILKKEISLKDYVRQTALISGFIAGCYRKDVDLIQKSYSDVLIEPQRAHLIPGFHTVKRVAMENGALGCTISGAGPAVIALAKSQKTAEKIKSAMVKAFENAGVAPATSWISKANKKGAYLL